MRLAADRQNRYLLLYYEAWTTMKALDILHTAATKLLPLLVILVLLPVLLSFDTIMYWVGRPTCLNCGSLPEFLQNSSLTFHVVSTYVGELNILGYKFGSKKHA